MNDQDLTQDNPLLKSSGLPPFDQIRPRHVVPAVRHVLQRAAAQVEDLERTLEPTWEGLIEQLDAIGRPFEYCWGPVQHLFGVMNSPELREAYESVLPEVVQFGLRLQQSEAIYQGLVALREGDEWDRLDEAQQRIVQQKLLDAELAGVALPPEQRQQFNAIAEELSAVTTRFANNVLDATKAYGLLISAPADAEGLPKSLLQIAAESFNQHKSAEEPEATAATGPWRFTLEAPSFVPFMKNCRVRALREEMYGAYMTRASSGDLDNTPLCLRILELRQQQAQLLGRKNYSEVSLARKMAGNSAAVESMLHQLREKSWQAARQDLEDLEALAGSEEEGDDIRHWDVAYWSERLRKRKFDFSDEELRPYFPHERVLEGLFALAGRLFGITVTPADGSASVWHKDVRFFEVADEQGHKIAAFYYDPYSRPETKRGGAWMGDCLSRRRVDGRLQLPVAYLVCNATPPVGDQPSLMTFREVETLFHEFGHGLQHMLTTVDYPDAAGITGIEWDAVELPSQFMENWCYHRPALLEMTSHIETGEPLPDELYRRIYAARTFRAGSDMLRQLTLGITDMELHTRFDPHGTETLFDVQRRVMEQTSVLPMFADDRFLCSFQHIFAGGYAAGYYSYKWAEVLSADAFAAFIEAGLDDEDEVSRLGRRFRDTVLASGGGRHPMNVFRDFRGRDPRPEALLLQNQLLEDPRSDADASN